MRRRIGTWAALVLSICAVPRLPAVSTYTCKAIPGYGGNGSGSQLYPTAINNQGQILGTAGSYPPQPFLTNQDGASLPLNIPPLFSAGNYAVIGLNNQGQVAGYGLDQTAPPARYRGFIANPDGSYVLIDPPADTPEQSFSDIYISSINDNGTVAGVITVRENNATKEYMFTRDTTGFFNLLSMASNYLYLAPSSTPLLQPRINNTPVVLYGQSYASDTLLFPDGSQKDLRYAYAGIPESYFGINNSNTVVGKATYPFVMTPDGRAPSVVCSELNAQGFQLTGYALNDNGTVAGNDGGGLFVATPTGFHAGLQLSNPSWGFGPTPVGQPGGSGVIYVSSNGVADLNIANVSVGDTGSSIDLFPDFQITNNTCAGSSGLPVTLAPGQFCAVTFSFTPQEPGARTGKMVIEDDALDAPQVIPLSGTGLGVGRLQFSNDYWTFNQQAVGSTSGPAVIYIYNPGTDAINFSSIAITGPNAADFAVSANGCGSALPAYTTCSITLQFAPKATGLRSAVLVFNDNSGTGTQVFPLTGPGY